MSDAESNLWEARARSVKAYKLARVLVRTCRETGFPLHELDGAHDLARAKAAKLAGVPVPSATTWAMACAITAEWLIDGPEA